MPNDHQTRPDHAAAQWAEPLLRPERVRAVELLWPRSASRSTTLDRLTRLAAHVLGTANAQVSLVGDRELVPSSHGPLRASVEVNLAISQSLAAVATVSPVPLIVPDTSLDERVMDLPIVRSGSIGSYCGVPLIARSGIAVGALAVFDRGSRPFEASAVELLVEMGSAVIAELEERTRTDRLLASATRLDRIVGAASLGAWEFWVESRRLVWDDQMLVLFDLPTEPTVGSIDGFFDLLHDDDREPTAARLQRAVLEQGDYEAEYRVRTQDGGWRWIRAWGRALVGDDGTVERVVGVATDTTNVATERDAVARSFDHMRTPVYSIDHDDRFTFVNHECELLLGTPRDLLLGGSFWDLVVGAASDPYRHGFAEARRTGQPIVVERFDGSTRVWWEVRIVPGPEGLTVHTIDISQRKKTEQARAAQLEHHRTVAEALEAAVLPEVLPDVGGVSLAAQYRAADVDANVGGDWYDAFVLDDHRLLLTVGDVTGHGLRAASVMGQLRNALRAFAMVDKGPGRVLWRLNDLLAHLEPTAMATVWLGELDLRTRQLTWATAGHPPAVLRRDDRASLLTGRPNPPIGAVRAPIEFHEHDVLLDDDDLLVVYTDGLVERRRESISVGLERLVTVIAELLPDPTTVRLGAVVDQLVAKDWVEDDVCVLAVGIHRVDRTLS
jgi:PAS domain S-box-containing protein